VRLLRARVGRPGAPTHIMLVTGSGHHSAGKGSGAPLLEAVTQFCRARCGAQVVFVKDDNGHTGAVKVPAAMLKA
jgi:hypothetical protein